MAPTYPDRATDATVLGDLVARDRRADGPALSCGDRSPSYRDCCTTAHRVGNLLRHLGVGRFDPDENRGTVEVAPDPLPEAVLALLGAAQLGAVTSFAPDGTARVTIVHVSAVDDYELPPGSTLVVHGGPPERPEVVHWEEQVWSENPRVHPVDVAPSDAVLVADGNRYTHEAVLAVAGRVADEAGMAAGTRVAVRAGLSDPRVVVAGVVAPLLAGATVVLSPGEVPEDASVGAGPEPVVVDPDDVAL